MELSFTPTIFSSLSSLVCSPSQCDLFQQASSKICPGTTKANSCPFSIVPIKTDTVNWAPYYTVTNVSTG